MGLDWERLDNYVRFCSHTILFLTFLVVYLPLCSENHSKARRGLCEVQRKGGNHRPGSTGNAAGVHLIFYRI